MLGGVSVEFAALFSEGCGWGEWESDGVGDEVGGNIPDFLFLSLSRYWDI